MKINLTQIAVSSMSIAISYRSDKELLVLWRKRIPTDILLIAYLNKPATLVTLDPNENSIGNEYPKKLVDIKKKSFLINCIPACKQTDLLDLGECQELELGCLAVTSIPCTDIQKYDLIKLFPLFDEEDFSIKEERFYRSDDGYVINWLNFTLPFEEVLKSIVERMNLYQIEVVVHIMK